MWNVEQGWALETWIERMLNDSIGLTGVGLSGYSWSLGVENIPRYTGRVQGDLATPRESSRPKDAREGLWQRGWCTDTSCSLKSIDVFRTYYRTDVRRKNAVFKMHQWTERNSTRRISAHGEPQIYAKTMMQNAKRYYLICSSKPFTRTTRKAMPLQKNKTGHPSIGYVACTRAQPSIKTTRATNVMMGVQDVVLVWSCQL